MQFEDYCSRYHTIAMSRENGVLEMRLHTRGGEAKWGITTQSLHAELGEAFADIARDRENKIIIITGTGDNFIAEMDSEAMAAEPSPGAMWGRLYEEGVALLQNLLAVPVPMIAAVNGPALIHSEIPVLCDIVLAAEHAQFADLAHSVNGVIPGDGVQTVWPMLLGPNRGRYFLLTGQRIGAEEAKQLGVVSEVLPAHKLVARAHELAEVLAKNPVRMLRHTRSVLVRNLRRRMAEELGAGLSIEALTTLDF